MEGWLRFDGKLSQYLGTIPREQRKEIRVAGGDTFLHMAIRLNDVAAAKMLIPICLNTQDDSGYTPLHVACYWGRSELIHMLLEANANPHMKNDSGHLPMQICCAKHDLACAGLFVLHGVRVSSTLEPNLIEPRLRRLEKSILIHRSTVCAILCIAKKKRDYRWDRWLLRILARQVWQMRFEAFGL